ncbi:RNA polymerase sigma factor sigA-like [Wolffia australiana]
MAIAAVMGLPGGSKRLLSTSFRHSDLSEKLFFPAVADHFSGQFSAAAPAGKSLITAKKTPELGRSSGHRSTQTRAVKAPEELVGGHSSTALSRDDEESDGELPLEALLLLQKSLLEKQWNLSSDTARRPPGVVRSGVSARQRRTSTRSGRCKRKQPLDAAGSLLSRSRGESLLDHAQVVALSKKIKAGIAMEEQRSKLEEKLGSEPTDAQLASSLSMSSSEMQKAMMESRMAREKLAMSNVRLVLSVAQKYDGMGAELDDLVQGGLIGLLRGIEKFDSSKGCRISTYVYWWIRQGVSRALVDNATILRLPPHLHGRLFSIRTAKSRLQERGIAPSIDKIAESMNISTKKVKNAVEAVSKVLSLDREAFPSQDGVSGRDTLHSYVAVEQPENNPWSRVQERSLQAEVNELLCAALSQRERDIVRLYYGLERESLTWEAISRQFGLSRERVRQVGLLAMEKLRREATRRGLEAMLR